MMKTKRLLLTMISVCMLLVTVIGSDGSVFAQQPDINAAFEEVLNDDKTESTVTLKITYDTTKFQVNKIIQPDKSEILPQENTPLITSAYAVKENGNLDFEVKYTDIASKEVKSEKFSYEVKGIQLPIPVQEEQPKEETKETNVAKRDLGKPTVVGTKFTDVEDNQGNWNYTIIDEANKKVEINGFRVIMASNIHLDKNISNSEFEMDMGGGAYYKKATIPKQVLYNGEQYAVTRVGDRLNFAEFLIADIELPDSITEIGKKFVGNTPSSIDELRRVYIPDSVLSIGDNSLYKFVLGRGEIDLTLPKNASYGDNSLGTYIGVRHLFLNPDEGFSVTLGDGCIFTMRGTKTVEFSKGVTKVGNRMLENMLEMESFSMWNTTLLGAEQDFSGNKPDAVYLLKSDTVVDLNNDQVYKALYNGLKDTDKNQLVYGMIEMKTTSNLTQTLKPGNTTSFVVSTEKSIGNDVVDKTVDFTTDWIDGGYTYSIAGNASASTVINGDALTVGSDETANSFTVTATSNFDSTKKVTFTINVDKTKEYVAQAIDYTRFYEGDNPNGKVVKKFETLQEAVDFRYITLSSDDGQVVIELLTDITIDSTVVVPTDYQLTRYIKSMTTAPSSNHKASGNPSLYTGASPDGRAVLKRGNSNQGALIEWALVNSSSHGGNYNLTNIIFDGGKSEGLTGDSLIIMTTTTFNSIKFATNNVKLFNNKNDLNHGGALRTIDGITNKSTININNSVISDCETIYSGGAFYVSISNSSINLNRLTEVTRCYAKENGGVIAVKEGADTGITVSARLYENKADGNGGAIYSKGQSYILISNATITGNEAGLLGSGIYYVPSKKTSWSSIVFEGALTNDADHVEIIVNDNIDARTKGNVYLGENAIFQISGDLSVESKIGITLAGVDENGKNRMEPGAIIGEWLKVINGPHDNGGGQMLINSERSGLDAIFRDTNNSSIGYVYPNEGKHLRDEVPDMVVFTELVWPESPMNFKVMDEADSTKLLENAEFKLHQCNDNTHDHSKESNTTLIKDSTCWNVLKTVTSDANGYVDFGDLSTGQYMLALSQSPTGYSKVDGQWFVNVNNSPNKEKPQIHTDRLSVINRGDVLPPNLTLALDSDGYFESGTLLLASEYLISFDAMGGTMSVGEATQTVGLNELIVKPTDPTLAGHGFEGWYTDDSFTTEWNFNTPVNASLTLYAKWDPIVYHVQFDANTGTGTMPDMNYGIGEELTLSKNTFIKIGFEFIGWNTSADGSGASYNDEAVIDSTPASSITLYAQWKAEGPSVYIQIPKAIDLKDDIDGYAKQSDEVKVIKSAGDASWYPEQDIQIRTSTSISLANNKSADTYDVSIFKSDDTQYTDDTTSLMILNVKDEAKQTETFTLKTKTDNTKIKNQYHGIMRFIIEFMP